MSSDELRALGGDITANGLRETIKYVRYNRRTEQYDDIERRGDDDDVDLILVDGRNRLDAMEMVGERVPATLDEFDKFSDKENLWFRNDEEIVRYIISANIRRRHLGSKDQDRIIGELLKLDPSKSDRQIGRETNVDHKKVGAVRHQLEDVGEIPHVEKRTDTKGRKQPARKKSSPPKKLHLPPEQVQDDEPTLFDDLSPPLAAEALPAEKRDAAPPEPADAPQPPDDPTRECARNRKIAQGRYPMHEGLFMSHGALIHESFMSNVARCAAWRSATARTFPSAVMLPLGRTLMKKVSVVAAIALAAFLTVPSASFAASKHKSANDPATCTGGGCTAQNPDRVTQPCSGASCYKKTRKHKAPAAASDSTPK